MTNVTSLLATEIVSGTAPNRSEVSTSSLEELLQITFRNVTGNISHESDSATTELAELFFGIRTNITHLFSLAEIIQRGLPQLEPSPLRLEIPSMAGDLDAVQVTINYPKIKQSPWLASRLGTNISQQRHRLSQLLSSKHVSTRRRLANQTLETLHGHAFTNSFDMKRASRGIIIDDAENHQDMPTKDEISAGMENLESYPVPTSDRNTDREVPELTDMWLGGTRLQYNAPTECPYCGMEQILEGKYEWE